MPVRAEKEVGQPAVVFPSDVDDGEIQHIDHLAMKPSRIVEDFAIKHAVNDVAHGASCDEGDAEHHAKLGVLLGKAEQKKE